MNIWTGLLFLDGAVTDVALARELAGDPVAAPTADADATPRVATAADTYQRACERAL